MAPKPKPSPKTWYVLVGFDYCDTNGQWHRVEPGDEVNDLPDADTDWLLLHNAITDVAPEPAAAVIPAVTNDDADTETEA